MIRVYLVHNQNCRDAGHREVPGDSLESFTHLDVFCAREEIMSEERHESNVSDPVRAQFEDYFCGPARDKAYMLRALFMACQGGNEELLNSEMLISGIACTLDEIIWTLEEADKYIEKRTRDWAGR